MTLAEFNHLPRPMQEEGLAKCCGATAWVNKMIARFPFADKAHLLHTADQQWWQCTAADWLEAFNHHPRIGSRDAWSAKFATTAHWAADEQKNTGLASEQVINELLSGNKKYEEKFGFIFIVCATGKSAAEMLALLQLRLPNEKKKEIKIAAIEQNKITALRLAKLLA